MGKITKQAGNKPLKSAMYERFVQEYLKKPNAAQAAIRAGYSKNGANAKGSQLLAIVSIRERVAYLQAQIAEKVGVEVHAITAEFKKLAFSRVSKHLSNKNKISALENLGKHIGYYEKDNAQKKDNLADFLKALKDE